MALHMPGKHCADELHHCAHELHPQSVLGNSLRDFRELWEQAVMQVTEHDLMPQGTQC